VNSLVRSPARHDASIRHDDVNSFSLLFLPSYLCWGLGWNSVCSYYEIVIGGNAAAVSAAIVLVVQV
jgi:hypothetical protein